jgi:hypothetical protein
MSGQRGARAPSESAQAGDRLRRVREPVAWTLLVLTALTVIVSACQLFHLAGATIPVPAPPTAVSAPAAPATRGAPPAPAAPAQPGPPAARVSTFALRASVAAPQFYAAYVIAPPVLSVVLVAFSGGITKHARQVVSTASVVQAAMVVLGVIGLAGAAVSRTRPGTWFILEALLLAIAATALFFTGAVMWSRDLRPAAPRVPAR